MSLTHMMNETVTLPGGKQIVARFSFSRQVCHVPLPLNIAPGSKIYADHGREYEVLSVTDAVSAKRLDLRIVRVVMS